LHYLIIGGGPAGLTAAATLRRIDPESQVTILAKEKFPPYSKIALPYLLTRVVEESSLFLTMPAGVNLMLGEEAMKVFPEQRQVQTTSGKSYSFDRLLIATGAAPIRPDIEGSRLPFVFTIRDIPDVYGIRERLRSGKTGHVVIAGAGPVGLELGDALHRAGFGITLVISSDRVFSTMLDIPSSELLERRLTEKGVLIRKNTEISRICPSGEVLLNSGESRMCDAVIFGKGVTPSLEFLAESGIRTRLGIPVNEHQETNIPGIYAAGDVAETFDIVCGEPRVNALWPVSFEQGRVAACNMASRPLAYEGSFARNALRVFDTSLLAGGMAKSETLEVRRDQGRNFHSKIVLESGFLKGFVFVGEIRNEGFYVDLLRRRVQVSEHAVSLLRGSYNFAQFMKSSTRQ
jgi:NADPH-dependent 2,4-dienoyl-CoA reductase/sulfur reductase-like enzyme